MMTEREIFLEALELATPEARRAYLQQTCGAEVALRLKVEALLREHFSNDSLLAGSALDENRAEIVASAAEDSPAQIIGQYKLLEKIGEGGFGEVWMAEQREPVRRRVALKLIKLGMDSRQIVARFEAERQALAMMDHPNIAKILDAGTTSSMVHSPAGRTRHSRRTPSASSDHATSGPDPADQASPLISAGRPYFVMELVRGVKITDYCDQNGLPTQDRLRLFILVCQAIQHAHQKGIIHRDIKPSNVLVTLHDGVPVPKVIDFGIAKATQGDLTTRTVFTQFQQFIGTPAYISPEQAEMSGLDIDTRADIYSLGVLLYELLVGQTPFDPNELMKGGLDALRQIIREKEPVRPSTRLTQLQALARDSQLVTRHPSSLATDLDWIVMKCLEKDRARRYETANGLAMDLRRHLANEPVSARPPSQIYRLHRFARRNKAAALAAVVIVCALTLGLSISIMALLGERRAHAVAEHAFGLAEQQRKSAEIAREHAEQNALTARRNAYAADMFAAQQAFEIGNLGRARDLLEAHRPQPDRPDLRGFEWRYLWNLCQGDNFHTLVGHSNFVSCVAFSPDGQWLATGSADASVKLWDMAKRRLVATLPAHTRRVHWIEFSNDGETLATAGDDGLKVWNAHSHQLSFTLKEPGIARFAISPVSTVVAIAYGDPVYAEGHPGSMKVWDYVSHQVVRRFPEAGSRLAFSPDGKMLAAYSAKDDLKLWSIASGIELRTLTGAGEVLCLSFSPDGKTLASGNWGGEVTLWKVDTGARATLMSGSSGQVWSVAFSPDGKLLATGNSDQSLRLWNVTTGKEVSKLIGHGNEVWAVAFAPDGRTLATGGKDERVMLWSTAPKRAEVVLTNVHLAPSFSPDNKLLATANHGGPVTVWNIANRQPVWVLKSEEFAQFAEEEGTLATISTNHLLRFWDVATQTLRRTVPLMGITDSTQEFRFAIRGHRLAAVDDASLIRLYDTTTGHQLGKFRTWVKSIDWRHAEGLKFSPDARLLATTGSTDAVKLWDVETQTERNSLRGHKEPAQGLAFSPDGSLVASASYDGNVRFLRIATGEPEVALSGIKEGCSGIAFSPDDRTISVACEDGTVRLWNVATKREVVVLKHGKAPVRSVTFSSDSQTLVSVCENGILRFWDAPNPEERPAQNRQ